MAQHNELGKQGEEIAANYLEQKGYEIAERNWRHYPKEIDIIAWHNELLIIVEVRTRTSEEWENPKETITNGKIKLIRNNFV